MAARPLMDEKLSVHGSRSMNAAGLRDATVAIVACLARITRS